MHVCHQAVSVDVVRRDEHKFMRAYMHVFAVYHDIAFTLLAIQYFAVFVYMTFDYKAVVRPTAEIIGSVEIFFLIVHMLHLTFWLKYTTMLLACQ